MSVAGNAFRDLTASPSIYFISLVAYDVSVFGSLRFKRGKLKAWRAMVVDSRVHKSIARTFPKREHLAPVSVDELLHELPLLTGHGLFRVEEDDGVLHVRGRFTKAAFEARCRQLAALFLAAADVGADGDICFLGEGVFVGYGVSVGGGSGVLMTLSPDQVQNASMDPELDVISGYFSVADAAPPSAAAPPPSTENPRTGLLDVPNPKRP